MTKQRRVTEYSLYRGRYIIGYVLGLIVITALMIFAALHVPGGLREAERSTAVASAALQFGEFDPSTVVSLPYNLLQRASFELFGVSSLSIKLPSLLLGLTSIVGIFFLIKEWYRKNVAMIATVLAATMPMFVFMAQDGTPTIYSIATAVWLLIAATHASRRHEPRLLWKVLLFVLLALNMYAPLGIYLNLAIVTTVIFHPRVRYLVRRINPNYIAIAAVTALVLLAPLLYSLTVKPDIGLSLLGLPDQVPNVIENAKNMFLTYVGIVPSTLPILQPALSIGTLLLIAIGVYRFALVKYTARSYVVWFWIMTLVPLVLINPSYVPYTFLLIVIMVAMGIATLIAEWYKLFPLNPYARVVGLLPLSIIVVGLVSSNASRYMTGYHYTPNLAHQFNQDLRLLDKSLTMADASSDQPIQLILTEEQADFYQTAAKYDDRFTVSTTTENHQAKYLISHDAWRTVPITKAPNYIATDDKSNKADRFYYYTADDDK